MEVTQTYLIHLISIFTGKNKKIEEIPFLPTSLFKKFELISVKKSSIVKVLTSSGTSGFPSKIFLDKENALNQRKILNKIVTSVLGDKRLPMLIIDKNIYKNATKSFNARAAAIHGFSIFGKDHTFLLNNEDEIDYDNLNNFLNRNSKTNIFIFGFTSYIYDNLIKKLNKKLLKETFLNSILIHGGGWKKMEKNKINNVRFKNMLNNNLRIKKIHNYYGLAEQTGSIFFDCEKCGCFVTSIFSDILIRDKSFRVLENGHRGIIQLFSLLPTSYPGHNILTEDEGEIIKSKDCVCSNKGKRFKVYGRNMQSEIKGCSDV